MFNIFKRINNEGRNIKQEKKKFNTNWNKYSNVKTVPSTIAPAPPPPPKQD